MSSLLGGHAAHLAAGVGVPAVFLLWLAAAVRRGPGLAPARPGRGARPAAAASAVTAGVPWKGARPAAAAALVAAVVHAGVCPEHFAESPLYGAFFVALGLGQLALAGLLLRRPRPALLLAGLLSNAAVVALWIWTRTLGVPIGPHRHVERIGTADLAATAAELLVIVLCAHGLARVANTEQEKPTADTGRSAVTPLPIRGFQRPAERGDSDIPRAAK